MTNMRYDGDDVVCSGNEQDRGDDDDNDNDNDNDDDDDVCSGNEQDRGGQVGASCSA